MIEPCLCGDELCQKCFPSNKEHHEFCTYYVDGDWDDCICRELRNTDKAEEADFMNDLYREDGVAG